MGRLNFCYTILFAVFFVESFCSVHDPNNSAGSGDGVGLVASEIYIEDNDEAADNELDGNIAVITDPPPITPDIAVKIAEIKVTTESTPTTTDAHVHSTVIFSSSPPTSSPSTEKTPPVGAMIVEAVPSPESIAKDEQLLVFRPPPSEIDYFTTKKEDDGEDNDGLLFNKTSTTSLPLTSVSSISTVPSIGTAEADHVTTTSNNATQEAVGIVTSLGLDKEAAISPMPPTVALKGFNMSDSENDFVILGYENFTTNITSVNSVTSQNETEAFLTISAVEAAGPTTPREPEFLSNRTFGFAREHEFLSNRTFGFVVSSTTAAPSDFNNRTTVPVTAEPKLESNNVTEKTSPPTTTTRLETTTSTAKVETTTITMSTITSTMTRAIKQISTTLGAVITRVGSISTPASTTVTSTTTLKPTTTGFLAFLDPQFEKKYIPKKKPTQEEQIQPLQCYICANSSTSCDISIGLNDVQQNNFVAYDVATVGVNLIQCPPTARSCAKQTVTVRYLFNSDVKYETTVTRFCSNVLQDSCEAKAGSSSTYEQCYCRSHACNSANNNIIKSSSFYYLKSFLILSSSFLLQFTR